MIFGIFQYMSIFKGLNNSKIYVRSPNAKLSDSFSMYIFTNRINPYPNYSLYIYSNVECDLMIFGIFQYKPICIRINLSKLYVRSPNAKLSYSFSIYIFTNRINPFPNYFL